MPARQRDWKALLFLEERLSDRWGFFVRGAGVGIYICSGGGNCDLSGKLLPSIAFTVLFFSSSVCVKVGPASCRGFEHNPRASFDAPASCCFLVLVKKNCLRSQSQ